MIHASPDAGPVDVAPAGGDALVSGLEFPNASDYAEVPAGTYDINVLAAGTDTVAISAPGTAVASDTVYTAFAVGTAAAGDLSVILTADSTSGMTTMPDTGGPSLIAIAGAGMLALAAVSGFVGVRVRSRYNS